MIGENSYDISPKNIDKSEKLAQDLCRLNGHVRQSTIEPIEVSMVVLITDPVSQKHALTSFIS